MNFMTLCSGVEAVSLAWEPLGLTPIAFSEIEPFPSAVLAHHWPDVRNLGDMTKIDGRYYRGTDILWGSTPCQAFSLSGRRQGTNDPRGALTMAFCRLANEINPKVVCWENVKGVLSDKRNAFGGFLAALVGEDCPLEPPGGRWTHAGYVSGPRRRLAWRLLDAQYSGVAQQRQRVFVVAVPLDGPDPREILFERHQGEQAGRPVLPDSGESPEDRAYAIAIRGRDGGERCEQGGQVSNCLRAATGGSDKAFVLHRGSIRLLTPLECERLMGFPEGHTAIPGAADGPRYKAIGNSLAVPDVRWLGERILKAFS